MKLQRFILPLALLSVSACSQAEPPVAAAANPAPAAATAQETTITSAQAAETAIRSSLKQAIPEIEIERIRPAEFPGMYEVKAKGYGVAYVTADGRYMMQGELFKLSGKDTINLTEQTLSAERKVALAALQAKDMIVFPATGKPRGVAYVFTDIDCGYCRKLHSEIQQVNSLGVEIRYLAFPRAGFPSPSASRLQAVWCSADKRAALTQAKQGLPVNAPACDDPVRKQFELGQQLGVHGTPAVFLADGTQIGGYLPPRELANAVAGGN